MLYKTVNFFGKAYNYAIALVRRDSGSVSMGFAYALINYVFSFLMIMVMMVFIRGTIGAKIRGEFGLYILSGVALYLLHNKILSQLSNPRADRQLMPILAVTPSVMIMGKVLHTTYMQVIIICLFLAGMWVWYSGFSFEYPVRAFWIFILCLGWSVAVSMCAYSLVPVSKAIEKLVMFYRRLGVITSGKMIPGNMLTGAFHGMFAWNPLYHCIDQIRGAVFINYSPYNSNLAYPIKATVFASALAVLLYVGLKRFR